MALNDENIEPGASSEAGSRSGSEGLTEIPEQVAGSSRDFWGTVWPWALAALSGVLVSVNFPPFNLATSWFSLVPLIFALWFARNDRGERRFGPGKAFLLGWVMGLFYFGITFFWIRHVTWLGMSLLVCYLAVYPAIWASFFALLCRPGSTLLSPLVPVPRGDLLTEGHAGVWTNSWHNLRLALFAGVAWAGLEWLRGWLMGGFGWNGLGVSLHGNPVLIQAAAITGVPGLSALIVFANVMLVAILTRIVFEIGRGKRKPHFDFIVTISLVALVFLYGMQRLRKQEMELQELRVAVVQPNIPLAMYWDGSKMPEIREQFRTLTLVAAASNPDLLVWPESALHHSVLGARTNLLNYELISEVLQLGDFNFLLGTTYDKIPEEVEGPGEEQLTEEELLSYNSALLIPRETEAGVQLYHKYHLVPFGEYVPFRESFPLLAWIVGDQVPSDFLSGGQIEVLTTDEPEMRLAPLICFEDTIPRLARRFVLEGNGELFVNITNDGWFLESQAAEQHLVNAQFRTVENARPMVRCANTGVSAFISARGIILERIEDESGDTFVSQTRTRDVLVPKNGEITFYTRYGDVFGIGAFILAGLGYTLGLVSRLKKDPEEVVPTTG